MVSAENYLGDFLTTFERITKKPEAYLSVQPSVATDVKSFLKGLYDFTKGIEEGALSNEALPELIVQDFDVEQIWQELELQNDGRSGNLVANVASLVARKDRLVFPISSKEEKRTTDKSSSSSSLAEKDEDENSSSMMASGDEMEITEEKKRVQKVNYRPSEVDDQFFKLNEMEHFLEQEENRETGRHNSDDEFIDLFQSSDDSGKEDEDLHYIDFFDSPQQDGERQELEENGNDMEWKEEEVEEEEEYEKNEEKEEAEIKELKRVRFDSPASSSSDEEEKVGVKSNLEMRQERLRTRISQLEEQALAEKPWQLKGEVSATARPQNSLLEEVVEFDLTTRPAPVITEQTTMKLEDIIRQRVKDRAWDDVERKVKPIETPNEYKKKLVLDQEKSKLSLAQVYEQEYIKQRDSQEGTDVQNQEESPEFQEVRAMMASLFKKLDALSNFHFTPRMPIPEVKVVSNLPAINLEEVAPVAASDAALLAPEEVKERPKGDLIGKAERTSTDKKRERRMKKTRQRERQHEREKRDRIVNKMRPGLGNKYSKEQAVRDLEKVTKSSNVMQVIEKSNSKAVRTSAAFFNHLQNEVKAHIKTKSSGGKDKAQKNIKSAKKLKL